MKVWISHRGNISGAFPERENHPEYIEEAILLNYDVEIDVHFVHGKWFLGHDKPQYEVKESFFTDNEGHLWCHAKNHAALIALRKLGIHCFWHQNDDFTITSDGYIWVYPGKPVHGGIACMPERDPNFSIAMDYQGICSDNIQMYRSLWRAWRKGHPTGVEI